MIEYYKVGFDFNSFEWWSGAKDRMDDATPEQKEKVEQRLNEWLGDSEDIPTEDDINNIVWFECDDIFNSEE